MDGVGWGGDDLFNDHIVHVRLCFNNILSTFLILDSKEQSLLNEDCNAPFRRVAIFI